MFQVKRKLAFVLFLVFLSASVVISCGKKADSEGSEHPSTEQPSDSTQNHSDEHPSDSTEHPSDSTKH